MSAETKTPEMTEMESRKLFVDHIADSDHESARREVLSAVERLERELAQYKATLDPQAGRYPWSSGVVGGMQQLTKAVVDFEQMEKVMSVLSDLTGTKRSPFRK